MLHAAATNGKNPDDEKNGHSPEKSAPAKVGAPSKYNPEVHDKIILAVAGFGATSAQIADALGVAESTFRLWLTKHPELSAAVKRAKDEADEKVGQSLYQRACGYSHPDVVVTQFQGQVTLTPIVKHYPPDTLACIFWLKNRQPKLWRDRKELELQGDGGKVEVTIDVFDNSPKQRKAGFANGAAGASNARLLVAETISNGGANGHGDS